MRGICCLAAAVVALGIPAAARAGNLMSVGHGAASERGSHVVQRVPQDAFTGFAPTTSEWQWSATHEDQVPTWVQTAAAQETIAVIDTGADLSAPCLAAKAPITYNVVTGQAAVSDDVGHGTFVASLAGGAPVGSAAMSGFGGDARLDIVQANRGGPSFTDVDESNAIVWAVDHGANIINLSLGGPQTSAIERAAIAYAISHDVLLVAAAGNSAQMGDPAMYPAALIGRAGLVVGAATDDGVRAAFSSTGTYVDVLAPGVNVLGALAGGVPEDGFFSPVALPGIAGTYAFGSGTSFAAPEVAGEAALVWAADPSLDAAQVAAIVDGTASGSGRWTASVGFGNVNVAAAVAQATTGTVPTLTVGTSPGPALLKARRPLKRLALP